MENILDKIKNGSAISKNLRYLTTKELIFIINAADNKDKDMNNVYIEVVIAYYGNYDIFNAVSFPLVLAKELAKRHEKLRNNYDNFVNQFTS